MNPYSPSRTLPGNGRNPYTPYTLYRGCKGCKGMGTPEEAKQ